MTDHRMIALSEIEKRLKRFDEMQRALDANSALLAEAVDALEEATRNLHNDFEPDNQSVAYKRAHASLAKLKAANAKAPQPEGHGTG